MKNSRRIKKKHSFHIKSNKCAKIDSPSRFTKWRFTQLFIGTTFPKRWRWMSSRISVNIWKQQGQYILWPNFISSRISIYSREIQCTQYPLLGRRKSLRNQRKKFLSLMEFKYLSRNYRKWINWTLCFSKQNGENNYADFLKDLLYLLEALRLNIKLCDFNTMKHHLTIVDMLDIIWIHDFLWNLG